MEQENQQIIDLAVKTNMLAENTNAKAIVLGMSNNEITNLSHALICLGDEDFENYVMALRTLRATAKSFDIVSKQFVPGYVKSENKVNVDSIPFNENIEYKEVKHRSQRFNLKPKDPFTKIPKQINNLAQEFFANGKQANFLDFSKFAFERIYGPISDFEEEYFYKFNKNISCHYSASIDGLKKNYGIWSIVK